MCPLAKAREKMFLRIVQMVKYLVLFYLAYTFISCGRVVEHGVSFYQFYHFRDEKGSEFPTLCVSSHTDIFSDEIMRRELDMIYEANFELVRRDFIWAELEVADDIYDIHALSRYERFVSELRKRGMEILALVVYGNIWVSDQSKACYERCQGKGCFYCDKFAPDPDKYSDFAKFIAQRFSLRYVEVWNEPNWIMFFNPVSPERYHHLLKKTYEKVKAVMPDTQIILGGLLSAETQVPKELFLKPEDFLASQRFDCFDAIAIHPYIGKRSMSYPPTLPPENSDKAYAPLPAVISRLKEIVKDKPILVTEIGWPTYQDGVSELEQANYLARALFISAMMGVNVFCVYELVDSSGDLLHPAEGNFGIIRSDYSPKLSFRFLRFSGRFRNRRYQGSVRVEFPHSSPYIVFSPAFAEPSGDLLVVIWVVDSQGNDVYRKVPVRVFVPGNRVKSVISFLEHELPYRSRKDHIEIEVNSIPVVVEVE